MARNHLSADLDQRSAQLERGEDAVARISTKGEKLSIRGPGRYPSIDSARAIDRGVPMSRRLVTAMISIGLFVSRARLATPQHDGVITIVVRFADLDVGRDAHPAIDLRIDTSVQLVTIDGPDIQAAIRVGTGSSPQLDREKLLDDRLVPVCHRKRRDHFGWQERSADLDRFPLPYALTELRDAWIGGRESEASWAALGDRFEDSLAVIRAADTSHGPALARWRLVEPLLRNGELMQVSPRMVPCARRYYFVCPPEYLDVANIRTFRDWPLSDGWLLNSHFIGLRA